VPRNAIAGFFAGCPENAFQRVPPGYAHFSVAQRAGAGEGTLGVSLGEI